MKKPQPQPRRFFGRGLPGVRPATLKGKLIAIEGPDGSGRSAQVAELKNWLEGRGHAIVDVGLRRSNLVAKPLQQLLQGNILNPITLSLFYATDFADQLENVIIPSLRAGFIVLADRYIYTLMARDIVRGADRAWVESLYGTALVPEAVFYLKVNPKQLVERNFLKNTTLQYWQSGMDLGLSRDMFTSFIRYQKLVQAELLRMHSRYGFTIIDGNRSVRRVAQELQLRVEALF